MLPLVSCVCFPRSAILPLILDQSPATSSGVIFLTFVNAVALTMGATFVLWSVRARLFTETSNPTRS